MSAIMEKPDAREKVQVLRRSMHRIERLLDEHYRCQPNPRLQREIDVLDAVIEDYRHREVQP